MNLQYLRVFLAVAEHEHVTHASEELALSQPAVTKTVQSLEREVGLELIERHGRRITLTYAGRVLHSHARRIFAVEREMEEALAAPATTEPATATAAETWTSGRRLGSWGMAFVVGAILTSLTHV